MWRKAIRGVDLEGLLEAFPHVQVLVVGDLILDEFVWGRVERISPEAPVPVVEVEGESRLLGGAANVAKNILSLGGQVELCGVVGEDASGQELMGMLREIGAGTEGVVTDGGRPTTVKTRVIASGQQVVRFDREDRSALPPELQEEICRRLRSLWGEADWVLVSDYGKGVITQRLMEEVRRLRAEAPKGVVVDPKVGSFPLYRGVTVMTPNTREAEAAAGRRIEGLQDLRDVGRRLLRRFGCEAVLITRGEEGMALFCRRRPLVLIPTVAREVYDVTGAGDTVAAVLTLCLAAGLGYLEAAALANCAAGVVVGKVGTAAVSPDELRSAVEQHRKEGLLARQT